MSIFGIGDTQKPTRLNKVQLNQSVLGYVRPVVMGKGKIQQSLLWQDGFTYKTISGATGKGLGGSGKGGQYDYSADVIAGLCQGPISSVGDVWSGQSWLSNNQTSESYTITGGTPSYTPVNASALTADNGVSAPVTYSTPTNDVGGVPGTLSGSALAALTYVKLGTALTSRTYTIDLTTGTYYFYAGDVGTAVTIEYSFNLEVSKNQEIDLIPTGKSINVGGSAPFAYDGGVTYYFTDTSNPLNGKELVKVSGTPTVTGTYAVTVPSSWTITDSAVYTFAPGDVGNEVLITYGLNNTDTHLVGTPTTLDFQLFEGSEGQSPWALVTSKYPGAALGYTGLAYVAYAPMDLGGGATVQENVFEVLTPDSWGGGVVDCCPVQCILQVLTNKVWGLGAGAIPFPTSAIDNGSSGSWGIGKQPNGLMIENSTAGAWWVANGFFISPVIDQQDTAASLIGRWIEAGQVAAFMSEGLLKLVPYGDTSTAGNGALWVAPQAFDAALDDTCFIATKGTDPVKISSAPWQDAYNTVQVSWNNRTNQYAPEVTQESDQGAINRYGLRIEDPQTWDFITTIPSAAFAASMRVKRMVYTRNTYEFKVSYRYGYLEPMSVVNITTSSAWAAGLNNENLAIVNLPVRITKTTDNPDGTIDIVAEDYPFGVHQPTIFNKGLSAGETQPNMFADPGNTEAVVFEATNRLTGYKGNEIWIGAVGTSASWGSCQVLASMDNSTYKVIGSIESAARLGILAADFPSGSDPDTVNSLVLNLVENSAALESGTTADADAANTLMYVGGELIAYSTCAITGQDQYTANGYIRRGLMGSSVAAHVAGELVMRIDESVFRYTYDPTWAGKTIYLKFQSVNAFGNSPQDPSTLTAIAFTVPGLNPGTIDASSGLVVQASSPFEGAGPLGWSPIA